MTTPLRVLIIDDSQEDTELLLTALRRGDYEPDWERVATCAEMEIALARKRWDVVVASQNLEHFGGFKALDFLRENGYDTPFILISDDVDEILAAESMKAGAQDYVLKNNLTRLCPAIARELREVEVRRDR